MYDRHAALVTTDLESASIYGVKTQSELNNSKYVHVVGSLPSDVMHDILEGVLLLHLKVMLRKLYWKRKDSPLINSIGGYTGLPLAPMIFETN